MYADKPIKVHCLIQAIARVNRVLKTSQRKCPRIRALDGAHHPAVKLHSGNRISSPPFSALSCERIPQSVIFADWIAFG